MITIYHNPRCNKSRACCLMLEDLNLNLNKINYTKELFTEHTLSEVIRLLKIYSSVKANHLRVDSVLNY